MGTADLQLFSDPDRLLPATDAFGRQMVISCGAALNHLEYAFESNLWRPVIHRLPHSADRELLAKIGFAPESSSSDVAVRMTSAIERRRTDRLPLQAPPEWKATLEHLVRIAARAGAELEDLGERSRPALEDVSRRMTGLRHDDPTYQAELRWWSGRGLFPDGVPEQARPSSRQQHSVHLSREFPPGSAGTPDGSPSEDRAAILLLSTSSDSRLDWLRSGEALSAVLLACTDRGLATCPVTHLTERAPSRTLLRELSAADNLPQVLIRVGVGARAGEPAPTPRRPLSEVLVRERPTPDGERNR
ncbi:Acg family FMN-binding oxidoreductase [Rhodococcus sp. NPDC056960]|uniref:Acg family FMN-binding oxidoreductase n=1 Tax=Rhodococcus sp. NPDC056960 TaxID=3345982 RepID=UPI003630F3DB